MLSLDWGGCNHFSQRAKIIFADHPAVAAQRYLPPPTQLSTFFLPTFRLPRPPFLRFLGHRFVIVRQQPSAARHQQSSIPISNMSTTHFFPPSASAFRLRLPHSPFRTPPSALPLPHSPFRTPPSALPLPHSAFFLPPSPSPFSSVFPPLIFRFPPFLPFFTMNHTDPEFVPAAAPLVSFLNPKCQRFAKEATTTPEPFFRLSAPCVSIGQTLSPVSCHLPRRIRQ